MSGINLCQINLYLTGLYGVRKKYIGFQYGAKFAEKTVSFLYTNEFGGSALVAGSFFVFANIAWFLLVIVGHILAFDIVGY